VSLLPQQIDLCVIRGMAVPHDQLMHLAVGGLADGRVTARCRNETVTAGLEQSRQRGRRRRRDRCSPYGCTTPAPARRHCREGTKLRGPRPPAVPNLCLCASVAVSGTLSARRSRARRKFKRRTTAAAPDARCSFHANGDSDATGRGAIRLLHPARSGSADRKPRSRLMTSISAGASSALLGADLEHVGALVLVG
jgi:hypothetical protein